MRQRLTTTAAACCLSLAFGLGAQPAAQGAPPSRPDYQLKAAVVSKFAEFIDWPDGALKGRPAFELCVARPSPIGKTLVDLMNGASVHGRPVTTPDVTETRPIDSCNVLVIPNLSPPLRREMLARAAKLPILTVGDYPEFMDEGGIIALRVVNGRIRFDVNLDAANRAKLKLGSQLLGLAMTVRGGRQ